MQSFAPWQQATIEIMLAISLAYDSYHVQSFTSQYLQSFHVAISLTIACSRYINNGVILHAHPFRGESHNQRNTTEEVATTSPPFYNEPHRSHVLRGHSPRSLHRDHSIIACSCYIYNGVILHAHPVRGESHNQRKVATVPSACC